MSKAKIRAALERLNWSYGRGDLIYVHYEPERGNCHQQGSALCRKQ